MIIDGTCFVTFSTCFSFFSFSTFHSVSSITDSYFFAAIVFLVNHSVTKFLKFVVEAMIPPQLSC